MCGSSDSLMRSKFYFRIVNADAYSICINGSMKEHFYSYKKLCLSLICYYVFKYRES